MTNREKACDGCEWYKSPIPTENTLNNRQIPTVITDSRRCERGWCDKEAREHESNG